MKTIETTGKDIEQALNAGLAELGCKIDDVDVKILQHPGIFKKARVSLTYYGTQETVETKTAASVMRNLQERAAKSAEVGDSRQKNYRDRKAEQNIARDARDSKDSRDNKFKGNERNHQNPQNSQNTQNYQNNQSVNNKNAGKDSAPKAAVNNAQNAYNNQAQQNQQNRERKEDKKPFEKPVKQEFKQQDFKQKEKDAKPTDKSGGVATSENNTDNGIFHAQGGQNQLAEPSKKAALPMPEEKKQLAEGAESRKSVESEDAKAKQDAKRQNQQSQDNTKFVSPEKLQSAANKAVAYLKRLSELMGESTDVKFTAAGNTIKAELITENEMFIGDKGVVLDAMEHLAAVNANGTDVRVVHVDLDCMNFRAKVNEHLNKLALDAAARALASGRRVAMPVMNSANRRIVHAALSDRTDVITRSEGKEPHRFIVIIPKSGKDGRDNRDGGQRRSYNGKKQHYNANKNFRKNNRKDNTEE